MIRAVFLDFDGTLFSHTLHAIPESAYQAIDECRKKGIKVFLCTGRARSELYDFDLPRLKIDGMIMSNGQMIFDENDQIIYEKVVDGKLKEILVRMFNEKKIPIYFCNEKDLFLNFVNDHIRKVQIAVSSPIPPIREYHDDKIIMASAFVSLDNAEEIIKELEPYAEITFWYEGAIDILPKGASKTSGIEEVLKIYDIDIRDTIAFGDGHNDLSMLMDCGIGVAMGNAIAELKENADYVTDDIDDDGFYNALRHFNII